MASTVAPTDTKKTGVAVNTPTGEADTHAELISVEKQQAMISEEVKVGSSGFIDLTDTGEPTGTIHAEKTPGKPQAAVSVTGPKVYDEVTTPSGAPLTEIMNPNPDHYDPGFAQRNPPEASPKAPEFPDKGGIAPGAYGSKTPDYSKPPQPAPTPKAAEEANKTST